MEKILYTEIKSEIKIKGLLSGSLAFMCIRLTRVLLSMLLYNIGPEVLASFTNTDRMIKGIQIGNCEIKVLNFADSTTTFLRDITCLNRIRMILKLHKNAKIN